MLKKGISMLLTFVLLLSFTTSTYAIEPMVPVEKIVDGSGAELQPLYEFVNRYSETLSISNGTATCKASLTGISGTTTNVKIVMTLQKKTLLWWDDVDSWYTIANTYYASLSKSISVGSGTYRVKAVYTVYSGAKSESITDYSSQKKC